MAASGSINCTKTGLLIDRTHMQTTEDSPCTYRKATRNITAFVVNSQAEQHGVSSDAKRQVKLDVTPRQ